MQDENTGENEGVDVMKGSELAAALVNAPLVWQTPQKL
jgi:hypothetical protein